MRPSTPHSVGEDVPHFWPPRPSTPAASRTKQVPRLQWHRNGQRWRLSSRDGLALAACALAALCVEAFAVSLHWSQPNDEWLVSATVFLSLLGDLVVAAAFFGYLRVSMRAVRPSQLHMHGAALLVRLMTIPCYLLAENLLLREMCGSAAAIGAVGYALAGFSKGALLLLAGQKIIDLAPMAAPCRVPARHWASALVGSAILFVASGALLFAWGAVLALRGESCEEILVSSDPATFAANLAVADRAIVLLLRFTVAVGVIGFLIVGTETVFVANHLRHLTVAKLAERQVQGSELAKVQTTLNHHVLGIFVLILSTQLLLVVAGLDNMNVLANGREPLENLIVWATSFLDIVCDVVGVLLLSGIGVLLFHEDPEVGDISAHIFGVLHSAVLTSRAATVFEGRVDVAERGSICIASFPGKYLGDWHALTWACEHGDVSSACVFLPTSDPLGRFGKHELRSDTPGRCWCHSLYGEQKQWGCLWFAAWQRNIEIAVGRDLELVVVFYPGQVGTGVVEWDDLSSSNLWDGIGLGGSQKAEMAYLKMRGFLVVQEDLAAFRRRINSLTSCRLRNSPR